MSASASKPQRRTRSPQHTRVEGNRLASRNGPVSDRSPTRNPSRDDSQLVASLYGRGGAGRGAAHARRRRCCSDCATSGATRQARSESCRWHWRRWDESGRRWRCAAALTNCPSPPWVYPAQGSTRVGSCAASTLWTSAAGLGFGRVGFVRMYRERPRCIRGSRRVKCSGGKGSEQCMRGARKLVRRQVRFGGTQLDALNTLRGPACRRSWWAARCARRRLCR